MTPYPPDWELLRQYTRDGSQPAFAQIVRRYIDFVYSTALRRTGRDTHLAEDITQAVFLVLAKRAGTIRAGVVLSGWLHHTARYVAANALKAEARHRRRQEALRDFGPSNQDTRMPQHTPENDPSGQWEAIAPLLDTALDRLAAADRNAVLLRFIQGKSHREVGQAIGLSEEAARKRIERAILRLREFFIARGVTVQAGAIGTLLATKAVEAAPALLTSATLAWAGGAATVPLAKGALAMMGWAKAKLVVAAVAATLLVSTAIVVTVKRFSAGSPRPIAQATPVPLRPTIAQAPQPGAAIEGTVFGIDGEPSPGAEVFLATASRGLSGFSPDRRRNPPQITEKDGRFSFPMPAESPAVVAIFHPDGYAQVEAATVLKTPQVFLQPWSRIEGILFDGDRPQPFEHIFIGHIVSAEDPLAHIVTHQTTVKTDKEGKFVLERVAPVALHLSRQRMPYHMFQSKWEFVELKPGRTTKVQLGGVGRHVVGRMLTPPEPVAGLNGPWSWGDRQRRISSEITARFMAVKGMSLPPDHEKLSREQLDKLRREWEASPEGRASRKYMFADEYPIEPDGTFRFEDLLPGKYSVYAVVRQEDVPHRFHEDVATANFQFEVPPMPPGQQRVGEPLDIGQIKMELRPRLIKGEPAPDFQLESLEGQPITLAAYKGKFLLLSLRYRWSREDEWAGLKKAHDAFSNEPKLAMLTVHLEPGGDNEGLKAKMKERGIGWPQAVVAGRDNRGQGWAAMHRAYQSGFGVTLIDPDGKVLMKNIRPETAETDVAKAILERR